MSRLIPFPGGRGAGRESKPPGDLAALSSRLQAADIGYLAVDRFLGNTAVASVFLGHDVGNQRPLTLKLVDSDLAYDVGGAEFVRGIGSTEELSEPHVLAPGPDPSVPGAICYVSPLATVEPLREHLARSQPVRFVDAIRITMEMARALDRWHSLRLAHGNVRWESLQLQSGQVLLAPPERVAYGLDAQRRDLQALIRILLEVLDPSIEKPERDRRWRRLHTALLRAAEGLGAPSPSAAWLADRLTEVEYRVTRPGAGRMASLRRFLASLWGRVRAIPGVVS
ncbi:MAG TPA: hypothetical protein VEU27_04460 [Gemmatimonadales bacterium]|nr:hypothetical protein [Gemmatimonadales bacterium]